MCILSESRPRATPGSGKARNRARYVCFNVRTPDNRGRLSDLRQGTVEGNESQTSRKRTSCGTPAPTTSAAFAMPHPGDVLKGAARGPAHLPEACLPCVNVQGGPAERGGPSSARAPPSRATRRAQPPGATHIDSRREPRRYSGWVQRAKRRFVRAVDAARLAVSGRVFLVVECENLGENDPGGFDAEGGSVEVSRHYTSDVLRLLRLFSGLELPSPERRLGTVGIPAGRSK